MPTIDPLVAEVRLSTTALQQQISAVTQEFKKFKQDVDRILSGNGSSTYASGVEKVGSAARQASGNIDELRDKLRLVNQITEAGLQTNKSYADTLNAVKVGLAGLKAGGAAAEIEELTRSIQSNKEALKQRDDEAKSSATASAEALKRSLKEQAAAILEFHKQTEAAEKQHQDLIAKFVREGQAAQATQAKSNAADFYKKQNEEAQAQIREANALAQQRNKAAKESDDEYIKARNREFAAEQELRKRQSQAVVEEGKAQAEAYRRETKELEEAAKERQRRLSAYVQKLNEKLPLGGQNLTGTFSDLGSGAANVFGAGAIGNIPPSQVAAGLQKSFEDARKAIGGVGEEVKKTSSLSEKLFSNFQRIATFTLASGIIVRSFFAIQNALEGIVTSGIQFASTLEQARFGIAALLTQSRELRDASGNLVSQIQAYPIYLQKAANLQREIQLLDAKTLGTGQDLQEVFTRVLAFTQNQVATDKERLQLAANILNASKLLGLSGEQIATEARQILTLEKDQGQQILQSLGLRARELRIFRDQGNLVQKLNELLRTYSIIAGDLGLSFEGLVTSAQTFFDILKGQAFENTFSALKDILKGVADEFKRITESGGIVSGLSASRDELRQFGANLADIAAKTTKLLADITNGLINFGAKSGDALRIFSPAFSTIKDTLSLIVALFADVVVSVDKFASALGNIKVPDALTKNIPQGIRDVGSAVLNSDAAKTLGGAARGAIGGATLGLAAAPFTGGASIVQGALFGAAAGATATAQALHEAEEALRQFYASGQPKLQQVRTDIEKISQGLNLHPEQFQLLIGYIPALQKQLADVRREAAGLSDDSEIKKPTLESIEILGQILQKLADQFEKTKSASQKFLSEEQIKFAEDLTKTFKDLNEEVAIQQRLNDAAKTVQSQGGGTDQLEIVQARIEAEQKILSQAKEINDLIDSINKKVKPGFEIDPESRQAIDDLLRSFGLTAQQLAGGKLSVESIARAAGDAAVKAATLSQETDKIKSHFDDAAKASQRLREVVDSLAGETASVNAAFARDIGALAKDQASIVAAKFDAVAGEVLKKTGELAKKFGSQELIPKEALDQLGQLELAKRREALAQSIKEEESFSNKRVALAEASIKRIAEAENLRLEAQKNAGQRELDNLAFLQKQAETNAGIAGRVNNSLEDRKRLIEEIARAETNLANIEIQKEQNKIDALQKKIKAEEDELRQLQSNKDDVLASLKAIDTTGTLEEQARRAQIVAKTYDDIAQSHREAIDKSNASIQESTSAIGGLQDKVGRITQQAVADIDKLSTTVVRLNDPIANFITNLYDGLQKGALNFKSIFKSFRDDVVGAFDDAFRESIKKKLKFDLDVKDNIGGLGDFISNTFGGAFDYVSSLFGNFGNSITGSGGFLSNIIGGGSSFVRSLLGQPITNPAANLTGQSGSGGLSFLNNIFGGNLSSGSAAATSTNIFGGTGGVTEISGVPDFFGGASGTGAVTNNGAGFGSGGLFSGGFGANLGAGLLGNGAADLLKGIFGFGSSKQARLGGSIGGLIGGIGGSFFGPLGAGVGSFLGNLLGSLIGGLFAPGRIATEKTDIQDFIKKAIPGISTKIAKEPQAAAGLGQLKDANAALLALGAQYAATQADKPTQGTVVRFAGQLAADLVRAGRNAKDAQADIQKLAQSLSLDLSSGIVSINELMGKNVLSFATFQEEIAESRKNLKKYADTSNLTVKELNDLATANGNTGSRIATVGETLAGVIDISAGFDQFVSGATIANNYLADSFDAVAKEGGIFNDELKGIEEQIRDGKLSLEEGVVALNKFRQEAGLGAVDLSKFTINAKEIQKQVDAIKGAGDAFRSAFGAAIQSGLSGAEAVDITKEFRMSIYKSILDSIVNGMVDGFLKATAASGPLSKIFGGLGDLVDKFVSGDLSREDFFASLKENLSQAAPIIDKIAEAVGIASDEFRKIIADIPGLNELLGKSEDKTKGFVDALGSATLSALSTGVSGTADVLSAKTQQAVDKFTQQFNKAKVGNFLVEGIEKSQTAVQKALRDSFYASFADTIKQAVVNGIINAALATGPLKQAFEVLGDEIEKFAKGKISLDDFIGNVGEELDKIKPVIDAIAEATGIAADKIDNLLKAKGITVDINATKINTVDLASTFADAASAGFVDGIVQGSSSGDVAKAIRQTFYRSIVQSVAQAFVQGILQAAAAAGPLRAASNIFNQLFSQFASGKLSKEDFFGNVRVLFAQIAPLISELASAVGDASVEFSGLLGDVGILSDVVQENTDAQQEATDAANDSAQAQKDAAASAAELAHSLRQAAKDLLNDPTLSPLKPNQRLAQAELDFEKIKADALAGNKDAINKLPEAGRRLLEEARKVFASSSGYEKIFDFVRQSLLEVADRIDPVVQAGDEQLRTLEEIRDLLKSTGARLLDTLKSQEKFNGILTGYIGNPGPPDTTNTGTTSGTGTSTGGTKTGTTGTTKTGTGGTGTGGTFNPKGPFDLTGNGGGGPFSAEESLTFLNQKFLGLLKEVAAANNLLARSTTLLSMIEENTAALKSCGCGGKTGTVPPPTTKTPPPTVVKQPKVPQAPPIAPSGKGSGFKAGCIYPFPVPGGILCWDANGNNYYPGVSGGVNTGTGTGTSANTTGTSNPTTTVGGTTITSGTGGVFGTSAGNDIGFVSGEGTKPNVVSLATGGIVKAPQIDAVLHGPEAVIPLPTANGKIEVAMPELLAEVRALRQEMASRESGNGSVNVSIDGSIQLGHEKVGDFVVKRIQTALDKEQVRVPKKAVKS